MGESLSILEDLLRSLFHPEELRRFIHLRVDERLVDCLPEGETHQLLTYRAVVALQKRGYIDSELFDRLVQEAPRREVEIRQVEKTFQRPEKSHNEDTHVRNLQESVRVMAMVLEKIMAGDRSERVWKSLAMVLTHLTACLIGKHFFNDQTPTDLASSPESQQRLIAEAEVTLSYARAYLDVSSRLLEHPGQCL